MNDYCPDCEFAYAIFGNPKGCVEHARSKMTRPHPGSPLDAAYASGLLEDPDYKRVSNKEGGTRIVDDDKWPKPCGHPQHEPPGHIVIPQGKKMIHTCPGCGATITIRPMAMYFR